MKLDYFFFTSKVQIETHTASLILTTKHITKLRLDSSQSFISIEKSEEFSIILNLNSRNVYKISANR